MALYNPGLKYFLYAYFKSREKHIKRRNIEGVQLLWSIEND
jgi:hypothetical protein